MPEATVYENDHPPLRQNDIGLSRQIFSMKAESITHFVKKTPHSHLRPGILDLDPAHVLRALFPIEPIHNPHHIGFTVVQTILAPFLP
jgi:hypothetical protein